MAELSSQMDSDLQPDVDDIMSAMNFRLEQRRYLGTCSALGKNWGNVIWTCLICDLFKHISF